MCKDKWLQEGGCRSTKNIALAVFALQKSELCSIALSIRHFEYLSISQQPKLTWHKTTIIAVVGSFVSILCYQFVPNTTIGQGG